MTDIIQEIISLSKRRGFVFPSSEIYGGFGASYDYGPLGVILKRNLKEAWRQDMTKKKLSIAEIDTSIVLNPKVWEASGHLGSGFADRLVECKKCHHRFKEEEMIDGRCPECEGELTDPREFNLMMKTFIGPAEDKQSPAYLRPETCQGIFINFLNVVNTMRLDVPFGIIQIGKAFRNEINPKNFIYRTREFEQMEMEWFCSEGETKKWFDYWKEQRMQWFIDLGIKAENLRFKETGKDELAHYARRAVDIEYHFPFGWREIEGIHDRGNFDLSNHSRQSQKELSLKDPENQSNHIPYVIETSVGVERTFLALLCDVYEKVEGGRGENSKQKTEIYLHFQPSLSPVQVAILPLAKNNPALVEKAKEIYNKLRLQFRCQYDQGGSIGRRYRRQDEIGTALAITVDFQSLEDGTVTCRDRDSMKQSRLKIVDLSTNIFQIILGEKQN